MANFLFDAKSLKSGYITWMKSREIVLYRDIGPYLHAIQEHLEQAEAENGLFLGVLSSLQAQPPAKQPFMAHIRSGTKTLGAAFFHELNLIVTPHPTEAWRAIATQLRELQIDIPGVIGFAPSAQCMAEAWAKVRGCEAILRREERIYQLFQVNPIPEVRGRARLVTERDVDTLVAWLFGFFQDITPKESTTLDHAKKRAKEYLESQSTFFWEVDGVSVAMARLCRPTVHGISVSAVYTPPQYRRQGYATALVAAVSTEGLHRKKQFCVLFTDRMNPTSNAIYQKVGYKPVCEFRNYSFRY